MGSIKILHASDLHISIHKQLRSPLDQLEDLGGLSASKVGDQMAIAKNLMAAWWKGIAASSYDPEILEAFAEFVYKYARRKLDSDENEILEDGEARIDGVVLTGDLATTGRKDDIQRVAKFLRAKFNPRHPHKSGEIDYRGATLSALRVPILVLPGNHDRFIPTHDIKGVPTFFRPGGIFFDQFLFDFQRHPFPKIEMTIAVSGNKILKVVILAADFTLQHFDDHEGLYGWLGQGKAYAEICQRLATVTADLKRKKKENEILCVLWATHFPPAYPNWPNHSKLLAEENLINQANRAGISAILCGHTHEQLTYRNPSMSFRVFCCGTTTQHEPLAKSGSSDYQDSARGNFFQIISISADERGQVEISARDFRYSNLGKRGEPRLMRWAATLSNP